MAQPQMARITCGQCNGWYNSVRELRAHMQTAHRRFVPVPEPHNFEDQLGTSKGEWTELSVQLKSEPASTQKN